MKRIAFTFALLSLVLGNLLAEENVPESTSSTIIKNVRTIKSPRFVRPLWRSG